MFTPSKYQAAIFAFLADVANKASVLIQAVAGSGKTTTIVKVLDSLPRMASVVFLAFNKAIATELATRVPSNVLAKTFHSLGMSALQKSVGRRLRVDAQKVQRILWDMFPKEAGKQARELTMYGAFVKRLVSLAKNAGIGVLVPDESENWVALILHHDLTLDNRNANEQRAIEIARDVLRTSTANGRNTIDFDDMLYLPLLWDIRFDTFDFVFIDEYQDTNSVQVAIVERLCKPSTRVVAVGDTHQAIYGFRGADALAMPRFHETFKNTVELPLSVCYRCAKSIVKWAQTYVPHIEAAADASEGKVEHLEKYNEKTFKNTDVIVCRNVAPLVAMAYQFISKAIGVKILGRDIGENLIKMIKKLDATTIDDLLEKMDVFRAREVGALLDKGYDQQAAALNDRCDCIVFLVDSLKETSRTIDTLMVNITNLFSDSASGLLTLCTVHKSKGLEWNRVFILDFEKLMPSKWATKEWQLEQEKNLIYVAATRAREELYFINSGTWQREQAPVTAPVNFNPKQIDISPALERD